MTMLRVRKLADKSTGTRVVRFDPETGERKLVNPDTPGDSHEPWPLLGVQFEGEAPQETKVPTKYVEAAIAEGWMERVNERPVVRPAGPRQNVWSSTHNGTPHTFIHCDQIIFHMVEGDYTYEVVHQPDKYLADGHDDDTVTPEEYAAGNTRVDHWYGLELIDG